MISQRMAATSSCAHSLNRRPVARLAIPIEAPAHSSTASAIRFSVPGRRSTGVSTLASSSGTTSDEGYVRRWAQEGLGAYSKYA